MNISDIKEFDLTVEEEDLAKSEQIFGCNYDTSLIRNCPIAVAAKRKFKDKFVSMGTEMISLEEKGKRIIFKGNDKAELITDNSYTNQIIEGDTRKAIGHLLPITIKFIKI